MVNRLSHGLFTQLQTHRHYSSEEEQLLDGVVKNKNPEPPKSPKQIEEDNLQPLTAEEMLLKEITKCISLPSLDAILTEQTLLMFNFRVLSETLAHLLVVLKIKNQLLLYSKEYSSILVKLSDKFIEELSTLKAPSTANAALPIGIRKASPSEADLIHSVRVLHIFSQLPSFNPGGDRVGLLNMSTFFRIQILPQLRTLRTAEYHDVVVDLVAAFGKLFALAQRQEQEALETAIRLEIAAYEQTLNINNNISNNNNSQRPVKNGNASSAQPLSHLPEELVQRARAVALMNGSGGVGISNPFGAVVGSSSSVSSSQSSLIGDEQLLRAACQVVLPHVPKLSSRNLGKLAQALAASNFLDFPLMSAIAATIQTRLPSPGLSLGNLLNSFCRLEIGCAPLCEAIASQLLRNPRAISACSLRELADIIHGFGRAKFFHAEFLSVASGFIQRRLDEATPKQLAQIAWTYAQFKVEDEDLFLALCSRALVGLDTAAPPQIASLLGACAKVGFVFPQLYDTAAVALADKADTCQAQTLAGALKALAARQAFNADLMAAAEKRALFLLRDPLTSPKLLFQNVAELAWAFSLTDAEGLEGYHPPAELYDALAAAAAGPEKIVDLRNGMLIAEAFAAVGRKDEAVFGRLEKTLEDWLPDCGPHYLCRILRSFTLSGYPVSERFWLRCLDVVSLHWSRFAYSNELRAVAAAAIHDNPATAKYAANHPVLSEIPPRGLPTYPRDRKGEGEGDGVPVYDTGSEPLWPPAALEEAGLTSKIVVARAAEILVAADDAYFAETGSSGNSGAAVNV